ncbi:acyltransferase [Spirosoma foliorum]|uniref:Acyltransferase n=1 Tax=Spirosoma foliorum TaxID=2710596 RepID=A0A7G5H2C7_9BACT|nr:acyltransferase [Spirosoma foliorum]QMW05269.1 acyltransferase [Spirosoma foliorum]
MLFRISRLAYRSVRFVKRRIWQVAQQALTQLHFYLNGVRYGKGMRSYGVPVIDIVDGSLMIVGESFVLINGMNYSNRIGRQQPCFFIANLGGKIQIGDHVGMSATALVCHESITIGNNVTIGGNTVIYDTDFHSLDATIRAGHADNALAATAPVLIQDGAFIGAHVTILKGVTIGHHAVIGAGSVVTKSVPARQIWAGNPAQFVKDLSTDSGS